MTYTEFNDAIRVYIKRQYGYEFRARLMDFTFDEHGRAFALVYNEETKKFLTIPIDDVRFVNDSDVKSKVWYDAEQSVIQYCVANGIGIDKHVIPCVVSDTLKAKVLCKKLKELLDKDEFLYPVKEVLKTELQNLENEMPIIEQREGLKQDLERLKNVISVTDEDIIEDSNSSEDTDTELLESPNEYYENKNEENTEE